VGGSAVMLCYWEKPELSRAAFWEPDPARGGIPLYRTGDRVHRDERGLLRFLGRRDRQIKRRGYRIELGELEATLAELRGVRECAVVAIPDEQDGCRLRAVVVADTDAELSVLTVKLHCGRLLPAYMVPDLVEFRSSLPRTATGKVDLTGLRALGPPSS
jgi:acyl-CoA synthetase (AMP-forming)/AMP-acid ligase II